jgi:hypothetical protein
MGKREIWGGKRRARLWIWAVAAGAAVLALGGLWVVLQHNGMPSQGAVDEALAPYSTGSEGCRPYSGAIQSLDLPITLDWMWIDAITENGAWVAAEVAPKKARITAHVIDDKDGEGQFVAYDFEACDS